MANNATTTTVLGSFGFTQALRGGGFHKLKELAALVSELHTGVVGVVEELLEGRENLGVLDGDGFGAACGITRNLRLVFEVGGFGDLLSGVATDHFEVLHSSISQSTICIVFS